MLTDLYFACSVFLHTSLGVYTTHTEPRFKVSSDSMCMYFIILRSQKDNSLYKIIIIYKIVQHQFKLHDTDRKIRQKKKKSVPDHPTNPSLDSEVWGRGWDGKHNIDR